MSEQKKYEKKTADQQFAEEIIRQLEAGTAPWVRPWDFCEAYRDTPFNAISKAEYRGANILRLFMSAAKHGFSDSRWMTYRQAKERGWYVREGEHGTAINFFKVYDRDQENENGEEEKVRHMAIKTYVVFNAQQIEGIESVRTSLPELRWEPIEIGDRIIANSRARIFHDGGNRAFYDFMKDEIHLPEREAFRTAAGYYSTALHELAHWTGNVGRCDRKMASSFGTQAYAREELRAEIGSWMLAVHTGLPFDPAEHTNYIGNWIKTLKEDYREIFRACQDAQRIVDFLMQGIVLGQEAETAEA